MLNVPICPCIILNLYLSSRYKIGYNTCKNVAKETKTREAMTMWQLHLRSCLSKSFHCYQYLLFRNLLLLSFSKSKVHSYFLLHILKFSLFCPSEKKVEHIVSWCCHLWLFVMSTALVTWVRTQLLFSEPRISCNTDYQQYDDSGLRRVKYQNSISR